MEELIKELKEKAMSYDLNNKQDRAVRGAYVDALVMVKEALNLHIVMPSFTDDERTQFVEETIMYNKQNLNGRETEDEIYEAGVCAGFDDLLEKLNEA